MVLKPCLDCGRPAQGTRCLDCGRAHERNRDRPSAAKRGYDRTHRAVRAAVLDRSTVCHLCGHEGADQADDVLPKSRGGASTVANLRPAHGTQPCPTCGKRCNQSRGNRAVSSPATQGDDYLE